MCGDCICCVDTVLFQKLEILQASTEILREVCTLKLWNCLAAQEDEMGSISFNW